MLDKNFEVGTLFSSFLFYYVCIMDKNFFKKLIFWKKWIFPGMYCFADGTVSSKAEVDGKKACGVVAFVRKNDYFAFAIEQKELPFSSDKLPYFSPWEKLNGKDATHFIFERGKELEKSVEAVQFCLNFNAHGFCQGDAFLPSKYEFLNASQFYETISKSFVSIGAAPMDYGLMYWTASGVCFYPVWMRGYGYNFGFGFVPFSRKCLVRPMFRFSY